MALVAILLAIEALGYVDQFAILKTDQTVLSSINTQQVAYPHGGVFIFSGVRIGFRAGLEDVFPPP